MDYRWSSYPAIINKGPAPQWLKPALIYDLYSRKNIKPVFGCDDFVDEATEYLDVPEPLFYQAQHRLPSINTIVHQVAAQFSVSVDSVLVTPRGRVQANIPRWATLKCCRDIGQQTLAGIAIAFNMGHNSGIYHATAKLLANKDPALQRCLELLIHDLPP